MRAVCATVLLGACSFHPADVQGDDAPAPIIDGAVADAPPVIPDGRLPDGPLPDGPLPDARPPDAGQPDATPPTCSASTPGLAACWDFENNTMDGSGNGN